VQAGMSSGINPQLRQHCLHMYHLLRGCRPSCTAGTSLCHVNGQSTEPTPSIVKSVLVQSLALNMPSYMTGQFHFTLHTCSLPHLQATHTRHQNTVAGEKAAWSTTCTQQRIMEDRCNIALQEKRALEVALMVRACLGGVGVPDGGHTITRLHCVCATLQSANVCCFQNRGRGAQPCRMQGSLQA
jgi:hypothetical protein